MKKWLPALLGLLFCVACIFGARMYVQQVLTEDLEVDVVSLTFSAQTMTTGEISIEMRVRNPTRLPGTFEGLDGQLRVAGRPFDHSLRVLQPGDRIGPGETKVLVVVVPLTAADVIGTAVGGILTGKVEASFQGEVVVSAFGVEVSAPVSETRSISLWRR
jgi:hypothetical protein